MSAPTIRSCCGWCTTREPGHDHASFDLLTGGVVTSTVTFSAVGQIFGTETPGFTGDDENWTRAQVVVYTPEEADSTLTGTYGSLVINQAGQWTYVLANGQANVQALAEGETVSTRSRCRSTDEYGATDTETVTVAVTGSNDAPTVSAAVTGGGAEGSGNASINLLDFASDVDHGAVLHVDNVVWDEVPGSMPAGFSLVGNTIVADTNALAYNAMAVGETFTTHFTYNVVDEHGASIVQHATVTITGTNDAPTVSAAVTGGGAEGSGNASINLLNFASDVDNGAVLHVENVVWDEVPGNMPAGLSLVGSSIVVDTNSPAYNAMAVGETFATHFTYNVVDEHGAATVQHATVTITGTNDAPNISGTTTGAVQENGTGQATGQLNSGDPDNGDILTWTAQGGTASADADFLFTADSLTITRNGGPFFFDGFSDGNPPPSAPNSRTARRRATPGLAWAALRRPGIA